MQLADKLTLDKPKTTRDGFLAVRAKAARAGVYDYRGADVGGKQYGFTDNDIVKVYRPADEVFAADSVASFLAKPVTNNHPDTAVTSANWVDHARGVNMGALRDGDYLAFDLVIMDGALIDEINGGKRELSNGYSCTLDWTSGVTDTGLQYDAIQRNIRGNHIAVVDRGRAGPECAIVDGQEKSGGKLFSDCVANYDLIKAVNDGEYRMKITLDGVSVTLTDANEVQAAFDEIKADSVKAIADAATELADTKAQIATLTGEKAVIEKQLADAQAIDIDALVADRAALVGTAKALKADIVTDGKSAETIRKEVVDAFLGDAAKDFDAGQVSGAFAVIAKDAKPQSAKVVPIGQLQPVLDAASTVEAARHARNVALANSYKGK